MPDMKQRSTTPIIIETIAPGPEWYPLQTRYQCEKKVDVGLRKEGFEYAPTRIEAGDGVTAQSCGSAASGLHVRMEAAPELLIKVLRLPGLVRFVTRGSDLVAVPSDAL